MIGTGTFCVMSRENGVHSREGGVLSREESVHEGLL